MQKYSRKLEKCCMMLNKSIGGLQAIWCIYLPSRATRKTIYYVSKFLPAVMGWCLPPMCRDFPLSSVFRSTVKVIFAQVLPFHSSKIRGLCLKKWHFKIFHSFCIGRYETQSCFWSFSLHPTFFFFLMNALVSLELE